MTVISLARRAAVVATGATAALTLAAGPASAAPSAGVHSGDLCANSTWDATATAAHACFWWSSFAANSSVSVDLGAYDRRADSKSARTYVTVSQWGPGIGSTAGVRTSLTNSSGSGTTKVSGPVTFRHVAGATEFFVTVQACAYDGSTGALSGCGIAELSEWGWS